MLFLLVPMEVINDRDPFITCTRALTVCSITIGISPDQCLVISCLDIVTLRIKKRWVCKFSVVQTAHVYNIIVLPAASFQRGN